MNSLVFRDSNNLLKIFNRLFIRLVSLLKIWSTIMAMKFEIRWTSSNLFSIKYILYSLSCTYRYRASSQHYILLIFFDKESKQKNIWHFPSMWLFFYAVIRRCGGKFSSKDLEKEFSVRSKSIQFYILNSCRVSSSNISRT